MLSKDIVGGGKIDYVLMSLYLSLVAIGWLMIYAVGYKQGYDVMEWGEFMLKTSVGKQSIFIGISIFLLLLIFSIDAKFWRVFAYPLYGIGIVLLILVLIFGREINGAKAWFSIGGFGFQPAEIAKLGTTLALSSYLSSPSISIKASKTMMSVVSFLLLPIILILIQPDAGSALVFLSFSIMLYREGLSPIPYVIAIALITLFILSLVFDPNIVVMSLMTLVSAIFVLNISKSRQLWTIGLLGIVSIAWISFYKVNAQAGIVVMLITVLTFVAIHSFRGRFRMVMLTTGTLLVSIILVYTTSFAFNNVLKKHQQERINVWLRPDKCDPRGAAYNLNSAKMAIGSGGLEGKGFLEGTMTQLNFVPEQQTDFIFCTVGEEQGFLGVFAVISIFLLFLVRLVIVAERQRSNFVRLYAYCLVGIFFFHFFINVGMTMGLMPIIGIPLPFVSAGGSSLLGFTAMLGILLKLDSSRYVI